jgi:nicotinamidase-related amidase
VDDRVRPIFDSAALITIDVQIDVLDGGPLSFASPAAVMPNLQQIVCAFRAARRPIVHAVRIYRSDGSNVDLCRRTSIESGDRVLLADTAGCELADELKPDASVRLDCAHLLAGGLQMLASGEVVMYKPRWGAFFDTPLVEHLHAVNVSTVVVIGCNYPNCPRTTIYEASERDFRIVAVSDAISRFDARAAQELDDIGVAVMTAEDVTEQVRDLELRRSNLEPTPGSNR